MKAVLTVWELFRDDIKGAVRKQSEIIGKCQLKQIEYVIRVRAACHQKEENVLLTTSIT